MNILTIAVTTGTGGKEFEREAEAFQKYWLGKGHNCTLAKIRKRRVYDMRQEVLDIIRQLDCQLDGLAFFCHGTWKHLKCGFHIWNVEELAEAVKMKTNDIDVALYACSTGLGLSGTGSGSLEWPWRLTSKVYKENPTLGKRGFAARLTWALNEQSIDTMVFAHGSRGHTTQNPYCYKFTVDLNEQNIQREPIVQRGGEEWILWKQRLKTFERFEIPFEETAK